MTSSPSVGGSGLNIVYDVTRECLAAIPDTSISGRRVARELTGRRGKSGMTVSDNGTGFTSNAILAWSKDHQVEWYYIAPGKPMQDGYVESFNGRIAMNSGTRACSLASTIPAAPSRNGWRISTMPGHIPRLAIRHRKLSPQPAPTLRPVRLRVPPLAQPAPYGVAETAEALVAAVPRGSVGIVGCGGSQPTRPTFTRSCNLNT